MDVKPENLVIGMDGLTSFKIKKNIGQTWKGMVGMLDFGLAQFFTYESPRNITIVGGSIEYMALNSMKFISSSPRQELQTMLYVGMYLTTEALPWNSIGWVDSIENVQNCKQKIEDHPDEQIDVRIFKHFQFFISIYSVE